MTLSYTDEWLTIYGGDCREELRSIADGSVHCVVTSPPYFGLRDYGTASWEGGDVACDHVQGALASSSSTLAGYTSENIKLRTNGMPFKGSCGKCGAVRVDRQLGLEARPEEYVANMVAVFREVRRVLRDDGTVWLNLGDSYASSGGERTYGSSDGGTGRGPGTRRHDVPASGLKPKDLVGIPWRVAFALQADGWYLRKRIVWCKPNAMPESVRDRPTSATEDLFLLAKSARYHYDAAAIAEPAAGQNAHDLTGPGYAAPGQAPQTGSRKQASTSAPGARARRAVGFNDRWDAAESEGLTAPTRNKRDWWVVPTQPYPGAHFAVMPEALVEPCVLAGCPDKACGECGAPWERVVERTTVMTRPGAASKLGVNESERRAQGRDTTVGLRQRPETTTTTTGWRLTCTHADAPTVPGVTLDPFGGSGTVARVANRLSRRAILIDLNPDYLEQQLERNRDMPLGLTA